MQKEQSAASLHLEHKYTSIYLEFKVWNAHFGTVPVILI